MATEKSTSPKTYSGQDLANLIGVEGIKVRRYIRSDGTRSAEARTYAYTPEEGAAILTGYIAKAEKIELDADEKDFDAEKVAALETEVEALFAPEPEEDTTEED